jgi:hypothetical protein
MFVRDSLQEAKSALPAPGISPAVQEPYGTPVRIGAALGCIDPGLAVAVVGLPDPPLRRSLAGPP